MNETEENIAKAAQLYVSDALSTKEELVSAVLDKAFDGRPRTPDVDASMAATVEEIAKLTTIIAGAFALDMIEDRVDGLQSDLEAAVQVAYNNGAEEWASLNYPSWIERLERNKRAAAERRQC